MQEDIIDTTSEAKNNMNDNRMLFIPPQTVFVGGYTVFTLSDRVSETFLCPKSFCVRNVLFL